MENDRAPAIAAQEYVLEQIPRYRRDEISSYLRLFGYKSERSVIQVRLAGSLGRRKPSARTTKSRQAAASRYHGTTLTVLGRTHDPTLVGRSIPPRSKNAELSSGYLGYLFMKKHECLKCPHELLPLDFIPASLPYPSDWKEMFGTKGFLVTMHAPSDFPEGKNELHLRLRRTRGAVDPKKRWEFLGELEGFGYFAMTAKRHR